MSYKKQIEQSLWIREGSIPLIQIIDQRHLPFKFVVADLDTTSDVISAIRDMKVRGAPLIGVTAAFGIFLACREQPGSDSYLMEAFRGIRDTRPTAVNLSHALHIQENVVLEEPDPGKRIESAFQTAKNLMEEEMAVCRMIGENGYSVIHEMYKQNKNKPVYILTHCNAGWLATVKYGTALAPVYLAHKKGIPLHVWVDETRPRNQGSRLTAWELMQAGIPHSIITDNAAGHLMQTGLVDLVLTGSDRTARNGDSANKIGTYLKALAAHDNGIPFYVAVPSSSIDWDLHDGHTIPVEERSDREVHYMSGMRSDGTIENMRITPVGSQARNFGFDITPARLISGLITEAGICKASETGLQNIFPEKFTEL